jgi:hypothetical protein
VNRAKRIHEEKAASLDDERERIKKRMQAEDERWALEREKLETDLRGGAKPMMGILRARACHRYPLNSPPAMMVASRQVVVFLALGNGLLKTALA